METATRRTGLVLQRYQESATSLLAKSSWVDVDRDPTSEDLAAASAGENSCFFRLADGTLQTKGFGPASAQIMRVVERDEWTEEA